MVDVFRYSAIVMIFLSIGFLVGWTFREYRRERFPVCIWGLVLSYILYAVAACIELEIRLSTPMTWRTPLVVIAALVGFGVQIRVYTSKPFERRRR